ncbi:hypothetical protein, partial [Sporolactobacillus inulinus]|uniref:hypothetical protein n=1 Tax=Sporolactobacillus inulinus TaxID=2078 RepID=UPI001ED9B029
FDSRPRHWAIGLKTGQNHIHSLPARKLGFAKPLAKAKSQDAAFYQTTYTRFLKKDPFSF